MTRPWQIWIVFGLSLAALIAAMGWISWTVLKLDRAQELAREEASLEENVRLSLWRMESALTPIIVREAMWPYFAYAAFHAAGQEYTAPKKGRNPPEILVPSPLLAQTPEHVILHFQIDPTGNLTSPQVPPRNQRELAESAVTTRERIDGAEARLGDLRPMVTWAGLLKAIPEENVLVERGMSPEHRRSPEANVQPPQWPEQRFSQQLPRRLLSAQQAPAQQGATQQSSSWQGPAEQQSEDVQVAQQTRRQQKDQFLRNANEWQARANNMEIASSNLVFPPLAFSRPEDFQVGLMKPLWVGDELFLVRRVSILGKEYFQGCWLAWAGLKKELLKRITDLVPTADLVKTAGDGDVSESRSLAGLPVMLVPGSIPIARDGMTSPTILSLAAAWVCVAMAGLAVAVLLKGTVALSERRAAFVSAVTHELRTPLTTFRMYTEMLQAGIVTDREKKRRYLETLGAEASRLTHLVENVLAYARLEKGRKGGRKESTTVEGVIERVKGRLQDRARGCGMQLQVEAAEEVRSSTLKVDVGAVEQILFNLVDNACKYAHEAADNSICLSAERGTNGLILRVKDHGPGILPADAKRLFRPFSKSARDAANSAPGVGLGLALSQRLAREMGCDLRLDPAAGDGACFVLTLRT